MKLEIVLLMLSEYPKYTPKRISELLGIPLQTVYHYKKQLKIANERLESLKKRGLLKWNGIGL